MKMLRNTAKAATVAVAGMFASLAPSGPAFAQEPFLGQMTFWAGNFAPRGWALCDGQILPINQYQALYSLLGTTYGGDGRTTFALPDMRGRSPVHAGSGPGLTPRQLGAKLGSEFNTLTVGQLPSHNHTGDLKATSTASNTTSANGAALATGGAYAGRASLDQTMAAGSAVTGNTGGGQQVNNLQPSTVLNCIIALQGIFPSRN